MKFRKKPIVIEAIRFEGPESLTKMRTAWGNTFDAFCSVGPKMAETLPISTLEGIMQACVGDWVIKGVKDEIYPCRHDIFELTYEPVKETP